MSYKLLLKYFYLNLTKNFVFFGSCKTVHKYKAFCDTFGLFILKIWLLI